MSKVVFKLSNGVDGEIQLRDNDFMEFWKFVFKRNNKLVGPRRDKKPNSSFIKFPKDDIFQLHKQQLWNNNYEDRKQHVERVNTAIDNLVQLGLKWTRGKANIDSHNNDCNRIHRGFTTFMQSRITDDLKLSRDQLIKIKHELVNFNHSSAIYYLNHVVDDFVLADFNTDAFELWLKAIPDLHEINAYIHKIEDQCIASDRFYAISKQHLDSLNKAAGRWPNLDWNSKGADGCTDSVRIDFNFADIRTMDMDIYSSDPKYNVYDLKNILGKSYETAWLNYDDPLNWDVTNTFNTTKGGFEIKPYQSQWINDFIKPWAQQHHVPDMDQIISPISIGTIDPRWSQQHCYVDNLEDFDTLELSIDQVDLIE